MSRRAPALFLALAILLLAGAPASAEVSDTAVKAAFIPKFARYVTWPPSASARTAGQMVLCIIGDDPFGASLDQAASSQSVDGRPFVVKHLPSAAGSGDCALAFIDGPQTGETLAAARAASRSSPSPTRAAARRAA